MVDVLYNARYAGVGSKQRVIGYDMRSPNAIVEVQSNLPNHFDGSAVIENLVIDGDDSNGDIAVGSTGILLKNVYNCLVRNVTIMNCEVGIRVQVTDGFWSQSNRFEHIRMINVKVGIVFEGTSNANDFSYTTIDDVRISLAGAPALSNVGIKVGSNANLYNAFIAATVWLCSSGGKALEVMSGGQLKYSLVNLEVESAGTGLYVNSGGIVLGNQSFLLTVMGVTAAITNNGVCNDVVLASA